MNCQICGTQENLVRDHNHKTGYIRGILCSKCNSWLGIYENKRLMRARHKEWFSKYETQILAHLASSTGEKFSNRGYVKTVRLKCAPKTTS